MLPLQGRDDPVDVVGLDQHVACLRALAGPDHAAALEDVHQPSRLGEADAQLALQHRGRAELGGDHQLDRLDHEVEVVADVVVELALGLLRDGDVVAVRRLQLRLAVLDDLVHLGLGDPGPLHAHGLARSHRQEEPVTLADQLLGARLVEDDPAVGRGCDVAKASRDGTLALIRPVTTSTLGRWVASTRWMPAARASWVIRTIASSTSRGRPSSGRRARRRSRRR